MPMATSNRRTDDDEGYSADYWVDTDHDSDSSYITDFSSTSRSVGTRQSHASNSGNSSHKSNGKVGPTATKKDSNSSKVSSLYKKGKQVMQKTKDYQRAYDYFNEALGIHETHQGGYDNNDPHVTAIIREKMGDAKELMGDKKDARINYEKSIMMSRLSPPHGTLNRKNGAGFVKFRRGKREWSEIDGLNERVTKKLSLIATNDEHDAAGGGPINYNNRFKGKLQAGGGGHSGPRPGLKRNDGLRKDKNRTQHLGKKQISSERMSPGFADDYNMGVKKFKEGDIHDAKKYFELAYGNKASTGKDSLEINLTREKIGDCAQQLHNYAEAQVHYEAVLRSLRRLLGDKNEHVLRVLVSSGDAYLKAEKWSFAAKCYEEAMEPRREDLGSNHKVVVDILKGLVQSYEEMLNRTRLHEERKQSFDKISELLSSYTKSSKTDNKYWNERGYFQLCYLRISKRMGYHYHKSKLDYDAMTVYQKALSVAIHENEITDDHRNELAEIREKMGELYEGKNQMDDAMTNYDKSLKLTKETRVGLSASLGLLLKVGKMHYDQGMDSEARPFMEDAIGVYNKNPKQKMKKADADSIIETMAILASMYTREQKMSMGAKILKSRIKFIKNYSGDKMQMAESFHRAGCILFEEGHYQEASECHKRVLTLKRQIYHVQSNDSITLTLRLLGNCLEKLKMPDKALQCYLECLAHSSEYQKVDLLFRMGFAYYERMETQKAIDCYNEALQNPCLMTVEDTNEDDSVRSCQSNESDTSTKVALCINLANVYFERGNHDNALKFYNEAYQFSNLTPSMDFLMGILYNMGLLHLMHGSYEKSETCYNQFLEHMETSTTNGKKQYALGDDTVANAMNNIGNVGLKLGKYHQTVNAYEKSLELKKRLYGHNSKKILGILYNLGVAYRHVNELDRALECYDVSLKILGPEDNGNDLKIANVYNKMGNIYTLKKDFLKARRHYDRSFKLKEGVVGGDYGGGVHTELLVTRHNVGLMLCRQGQYEEGKEVLLRCYELSQNNQGVNYTEIGKLLLDLSSVYLLTRNLTQAKEFMEKGFTKIQQFQKHLPRNHPYMKQASSLSQRINEIEWSFYKHGRSASWA